MAAGETGDVFTFTLNTDGTSFSVKGTNNLYWNGNADNTFTGWTDGHPFLLYNYTVEPYYGLTITCVDESGAVLQSAEHYLKAGDSYVLVEPVIKGYTLKTIDGDTDALSAVNRHLTLRLVYAEGEDTGIRPQQASSTQDRAYYINGTLVDVPAKGKMYISNGKVRIF